MRPTVPRLLAAACLWLGAMGSACAASVTAVTIRGLGPEMEANVRGALSLEQALGKDVSGRRLAALVRAAEAQTREALEPFGYYDPAITVDRARDAAGNSAVTITVAPGMPVRVRGSHVAIEGEGASDAVLQDDLAGFKPAAGEVFEHALYEASKARVGRRLAERGYFDADFLSRTVEVTRAAHAADIDLVWASGARHAFGPARFAQAPQAVVDANLLARLVPWTPGEPFHQDQLDRLRRSLVGLDYFSRIDIEPQPVAGAKDVPVLVTLAPAKRSVYTAGLSYGTDEGAGVRLGVERRYLNRRGHKALAQVDYAQERKTLTLQYRIPAFAWVDGWYTASLQAADEQTDYIDSRRVEFVASRSGELNPHLTVVASVHALRERWAYAVPPADPAAPAPVDYRYGTFVYPALRAEYITADDRLFPRDAITLALELRGGVEGAGSDADFLQDHATAWWYRGAGVDSRLILRGELGHTFTSGLVDMPPSLRFYAGGDRSIRGYGYREVGPRIETTSGLYATGARNVVTGSVEFEHYFHGPWGGAVFVDGGSAFDDHPEWRTGVGLGLRWRSPVGPVRVDVAHGLDHPDAPFQVYLSIGTAL